MVDFRVHTITYYDSLYKDAQDRIHHIQDLQCIKDYLLDEARSELVEPQEINWELINGDCPTQINNNDYGICAVTSADYLSCNFPLTYTGNDMQVFRKLLFLSIKRKHLT